MKLSITVNTSLPKRITEEQLKQFFLNEEFPSEYMPHAIVVFSDVSKEQLITWAQHNQISIQAILATYAKVKSLHSWITLWDNW